MNFLICRYDGRLFRFVGKFWKVNWITDIVSCLLCKKSLIGSRLWKIFLTPSMLIWLNLKASELFLALINLILECSLYFWSIIKIGSCSDESGHLYPLIGTFKIAINIKYSLNFSAIWSLREIFLPSSAKLILECFVTFSDRSGSTNFQNTLLSVTTLVSRLLQKFFFSCLTRLTHLFFNGACLPRVIFSYSLWLNTQVWQ